MGKLLIELGFVFIILGLGFLIIEHLGIERLPGDVVIHSEHATFFFPITTCILLSILLSFIARLFNR